MQLAISEAKKGSALTSPNPNVGAVIVKNGKILGSGWHKKAGLPHAEREAIAAALTNHSPDELRGSTIYVTLEPCSTQGRTPACVDGIIEAGISRVVYGSTDPNPSHAGGADSLLAKHQISVTRGIEESDCDDLILHFRKRITTGLPWVIAKTAMSLDGRITRPDGEGQWLTGVESRAEVHRIRATVDAIITSGETVRKDNPSLTIRGEATRDEKQQPWRVVLTQKGKSSLPADSSLFTDAFSDRTLIHHNKPLRQSLIELAELGCNSIMLECGGKLMSQYLAEELIDELALFIAPMMTGGDDLAFGASPHLSQSQLLKNSATTTTLGNDILIRGIIDKA